MSFMLHKSVLRSLKGTADENSTELRVGMTTICHHINCMIDRASLILTLTE
jgi:hypothetical protein